MRALVLQMMALLVGCASHPLAPPRQATDFCAVLGEKPHWRDPVMRSSQRWGIPPSVLLATVFHESSYRHDARPPRRYYLGIIPGPRPSSAYGYAQALDGTWDEYVASNFRWFARRDDFADALDFVGWYHSLSLREIGLRPDDTRNLYLAYHEGRTGFLRSTHLAKPWLLRYADRVALTEQSYRQQSDFCPLTP